MAGACLFAFVPRIPLRSCFGCAANSNESYREHNIIVDFRNGTQTAAEFGYPKVQARAKIPLKDAAHVSLLKTRVVEQLQALFGSERVHTTFGYQTKYQRIQVLNLPKSHANDAVAIACEPGEVVKPLAVVHQCRCLPRGNYQLFNGKHSEHKVSAPKKVRGWKLYELVEAKGQVGTSVADG